jgi:long-chain acyl-CoA synthetase
MSGNPEQSIDHWEWVENYPEEIQWQANIEPYAVHKMLEDTCKNYADRPGFDFLGKKYTWGDIGEQVNKFAKALQELGVKKGSKVGLFLPNCPYFLISYFAVLKAGAVVVNFNPLYAEKDLSHQISDSETDFMITLDLKDLYEKVKDLKHDTRLSNVIVCRFIDVLPFPKDVLFWMIKNKEISKVDKADDVHWYHEIINNDGNPNEVSIDVKNDIAVLQYTGGTTGTPKGAMLTHENVTSNVEQAAAWFVNKNIGQEKMLGVLPFFHVFAMTAVMNMSVKCAFEIIALPRFDLEQTLKVIHKKKPHFFPAVPAIYNAINHSKLLKKYDLHSLKYCISGGAPLPIEVKKAFEVNTDCVVVEGYGLTESSPVVTVNPVVGENKAGSIGLPLPDTIVELISIEDKKTRVAVGERGELCVRGPQVMKGYYNKPEETKDVLVDGLLYTGDIAIMDEEGYFYIVDRLKDMIITNGYNVYPRNVEEAIYLHPNVEECIVAGIPDKARGEIVKAWVKAKEGRDLSIEDLKEFLHDKLSKMEMPRLIEIRKEPLPKTMIGKLSKKDVLAQESDEAAKSD